MSGALQTCKSQNVDPAMTKIRFLARRLWTRLRSLECPNKYDLAILNAHMKSTENINSIKVPTSYYQKSNYCVQNFRKFENKSLDFLELQN